MNSTEILVKLCGTVLLAAAAAMLLGRARENYGRLVVLCCSILCLGAAAALLYPMISSFRQLARQSGVETYFTIMLRALGLGLLTQITVLCAREMGQATLAQSAELLGKLVILAQCLPLLEQLLSFARESLT